MYTIKALTHISQGTQLQIVIQFIYKDKIEITTTIVLIENVGSDLILIYTNQNFINACNAAIEARKNIIDNPFIF